MADLEPRRSVRATKGQHKSLELEQQPVEIPKRRGYKKATKKTAAREDADNSEEEVIRCICGATDQENNKDEMPWIACDKCAVWQHTTCMGMSHYQEDLPDKYYCERCRPGNHKELLAAISRGERPWEIYRQTYRDLKAEKEKKKKKPGRRGGGRKRASADAQQEDSSQLTKSSPAPRGTATPVPEPKPDEKTDPTVAGSKRKAREESHDVEVKSQPAQKVRKFSNHEAVPDVAASPTMKPIAVYTPPGDITAKVADLPEERSKPTKGLVKSLTHAITAAEKKGAFVATDGLSIADRAERFAIHIERAVHNTHLATSAYAKQMRTLYVNLKENTDLCMGLLAGTLLPPTLAVMTTDELATKELQDKTAEMKARAEKQAIKITEEGIPRMRKTHKGEELIGGDDNFIAPSASMPASSSRRASGRDAADKHRQPRPLNTNVRNGSPSPALAHTGGGDSARSPTNFNISKVFSSIKSPSAAQPKRQMSRPVAPPIAQGPGEDPDVDRMLEDDSSQQSPPYSPEGNTPKDDTSPDIVWRGDLVMSTIATLQVAARWAAGAKLNETIGLPWDKLMPKSLTIMGRIDEHQATVYLCGMRYRTPIDLVVFSMEPASEASRPEFERIYEYFSTKHRYAVVGDKGVANVRDTYVIPVPPGTRNFPEFLMNFADFNIPETRTRPMLLGVIVYRNDDADIKRIHGTVDEWHSLRMHGATAEPGMNGEAPQPPGTPAPAGAGGDVQQQYATTMPVPPSFSPTNLQGAFVMYPAGPQPPIPQPPVASQPTPPPQQQQQQQQQEQWSQSAAAASSQARDEALEQGKKVAEEVLGPYMTSPVVRIMLSQADKMNRREWELIKRIFSRDPRTRSDLAHLSKVIQEESEAKQQEAAASKGQGGAAASPPTQQPAQVSTAPLTSQHHPPPPQQQPQHQAQGAAQPQTMVQPQTQPPVQSAPSTVSAAAQQQQPAAPPAPVLAQPSQPVTAVRNTPVPLPQIPLSQPPPPPTAYSRPIRETPIPLPQIPSSSHITPAAAATAAAAVAAASVAGAPGQHPT